MAGEPVKNSDPPWLAAGFEHVWLPYAQMKTMAPPLAVARTQGCRIVLADGRELIDGIASWWTACHGYNHPHIRAAVERQLAEMPHVMFGGMAHEQALDAGAAAGRPAARRSQPRVLLRIRLGRRRSRAEDGAAILVQPRQRSPHPFPRLYRRLPRRHHRRYGGERSDDGMHALFAPLLPQHIVVDLARSDDGFAASGHAAGGKGRDHGRHRGRAAGAGRRRHDLSRGRRCCAGCARSPTNTSCC